MSVSSQYGRPEYWDERYLNKKEPFDWYQKWSGIKDIITQYVHHPDKILIVGCGSSRMSEDMMAEGYTSITGIDNSAIVIKDMQERYEGVEGLSFEEKDVRTMDFEPGSFNVILDKGTLDSVLCGDRSSVMARRMIDRVYGVLAPGGVYISVTYAPPEQRTYYFSKSSYDWQINTYQVAKPILSSTCL